MNPTSASTLIEARGVIELLDRPWAILPATLQRIEVLASAQLRGELGAPEAAGLARRNQGDKRGYEVVDGVAILPLRGVITQRPTWLSLLFEETPADGFNRSFTEAIADPNVRAVLLDVDSPGGEAIASQRIAQTIFAARGKKPLVAVGTGVMTSGAYWAAAAADRVLLGSPVVLTGSIGVALAHVDMSTAEQMRGVKITEVTAGKYKRIASEHKPLGDEGLAELQRIVNRLYDTFTGDVARFRQLPAERIRGTEARLFVGEEAILVGLVDGISAGKAIAEVFTARASLPSAKALPLPGAAAAQTREQAPGSKLEHLVARHGLDAVRLAIRERLEAMSSVGKR